MRHKTARDADREGIERGPNGRRLCRWCKEEVPKGKRTFCGKPECVHEWNIRANATYARSAVYERDHGVCCSCGLDTVALLRRLSAYHAMGFRPIVVDDENKIFGFSLFGLRRQVLGFDSGRQTLWDMDHIIPVIEGGGTCGLDNLRTLCVWCHRRATKALAKRRSKVPVKGRGKQKRKEEKARREQWVMERDKRRNDLI